MRERDFVERMRKRHVVALLGTPGQQRRIAHRAQKVLSFSGQRIPCTDGWMRFGERRQPCPLPLEADANAMQLVLRVHTVHAGEVMLEVSGFAFEPVGKLMREWESDALLPDNSRQAEMAEPVCQAFHVRIELALKRARNLSTTLGHLTREFVQQGVCLLEGVA